MTKIDIELKIKPKGNSNEGIISGDSSTTYYWLLSEGLANLINLSKIYYSTY